MRILVPVDGSAFSNAAVKFIASRTTLIGAEPDVELLNVQSAVRRSAARVADKALLRASYEAEADKVLKPAAAALKRAGLQARAKWVVGSPGIDIGKLAAAADADLIVMGSHGHTAFKTLLFGSVTNAVLASCTTPLLVVRDEVAPTRDSLKVGIAVDGSKYGIAAVRYVLKHLDLFGRQGDSPGPSITLIHVVPDLFSIIVPGFGDAPVAIRKPDQVIDMQTKAFEAALAPVRKLIKPTGLETTETSLIGNNAGDELAAYAKKNKLDVLVMGSHGYGALKSAVLGSVATRVAAKCRTPLLLIREK